MSLGTAIFQKRCSMASRTLLLTPRYKILQRHIIHCTTLQRTTPHCNTRMFVSYFCCNTLQHTATTYLLHKVDSNTQQHTATHCNTLQHTTTHCNTLQPTAKHLNSCRAIAATARPELRCVAVSSHHSVYCHCALL